MNLFQKLFAATKYAKGQHLLAALARGSTLKSHRDLEGNKKYMLHYLDGVQSQVDNAIVDQLKRQHMIDSNKKFPAETYILTQQGLNAAEKITRSTPRPLSSRNF